MGLRNIIARNLEALEKRNDAGKLAENFIFAQFEYGRDIGTEINFWRTKSGAEIDFVVRRERGVDLYEVKYAAGTKERKTAAMMSFGKKYGYNQAFIATSSVDKKKNSLVPFWQF